MDVLVMDATHGGVKLSIEFAKLPKYDKIYLHDIYRTLTKRQQEELDSKNVNIVDLSEIESEDLLVISPIHLPLSNKEIANRITSKRICFITHHEGVKILLEPLLKEDVLKIEVTGVKGKTSSVFMLKEILKDKNPLTLSSLGIIQTREGHDILLKKDVSITPANMKETVDLAHRVDNPSCGGEKTNNINYKSLILESSLGVSGIGDVGLLTNIVENYPIAKGRIDAKTAKSQVFKCKRIAIKKETLDKFYEKEKEEFKDKINTFSIKNKANVNPIAVSYGLDETEIEITYNNIKTIDNNLINGKFKVKCFAIGRHHIENVLGVITTALTLNISEDKIIQGLSNYNGVEGRTHIKNIGKLKVIEEINPGINTKAIEYSIDMVPNPEEYCIIIGGDYGVTCEEIDEKKVAKLLEDRHELNMILVGDVGKSINKQLIKPLNFIKTPENAINFAINSNLNVLFIYRSNYSKLSQR